MWSPPKPSWEVGRQNTEFVQSHRSGHASLPPYILVVRPRLVFTHVIVLQTVSAYYISKMVCGSSWIERIAVLVPIHSEEQCIRTHIAESHWYFENCFSMTSSKNISKALPKLEMTRPKWQKIWMSYRWHESNWTSALTPWQSAW